MQSNINQSIPNLPISADLHGILASEESALNLKNKFLCSQTFLKTDLKTCGYILKFYK